MKTPSQCRRASLPSGKLISRNGLKKPRPQRSLRPMFRLVAGQKRKSSLCVYQMQGGRRRLTHLAAPITTPPNQLLPVPRNGRIIKLLDAGSALCQRRGKSTARMKHLKLNILSKACKFQHLPPEKWLQAPGAARSQSQIEGPFSQA